MVPEATRAPIRDRAKSKPQARRVGSPEVGSGGGSFLRERSFAGFGAPLALGCLEKRNIPMMSSIENGQKKAKDALHDVADTATTTSKDWYSRAERLVQMAVRLAPLLSLIHI